MSRTYFPEAHYMPWGGQYLPTYRWHMEDPWSCVPGKKAYPTAGQAKTAAKAYLAAAMNKQIRSERAPPDADPLGLANWHERRAALAAETQEAALGGIISRGKIIRIERRARG